MKEDWKESIDRRVACMSDTQLTGTIDHFNARLGGA